MKKIKKAVIPIGGLGTRFLPLSKVIPKEFFPLISKPVIQHIIEEAIGAGIEEFIFVISPDKKKIFKEYVSRYFREDETLLSILKKRKKDGCLEELKSIPKMKYKYVVQEKPLGDGDAILKAERLVNKEPFLVLFGDDIAFGKNMAKQLIDSFNEVRGPLVCLYKMPKKELKHYGIPKVVNIKNKIYEIKGLIEKPKDAPPSSFAIIGKYIITPEIFSYLKKTKTEKGEIILLNAFKSLIKDNKQTLYGTTVEGKWLECGSKEKWLKSFLFLAGKE